MGDSFVPDLFVPDDYEPINYNKITELVSDIIFNNNSIPITNDNILLLLIRLLYHPLFNEDKTVAHYEIMDIINRALSYDSFERETWTNRICTRLLSDFNLKHFLSNIQASAQLIHMTLIAAETNYQIPTNVLSFLSGLYNSDNSEEKLISGLKQLLKSLIQDNGELSNTMESQLKEVVKQKQINSYPASRIERSTESMYKQFCRP